MDASPWRAVGSYGAGGAGSGLGVGDWSSPVTSNLFGGGPGYPGVDSFAQQPTTYQPPLAQINQVTALQRENDTLKLQNQQLTTQKQSLEHTLGMAEARSRQPNPEFTRRMTEMSRDCQRLHEEKEGLRRQLKQRETESEAAAAAHNQQVRQMSAYEEQLKAQIEQEKRNASDRTEQDRSQHQRDLELLRREKEQAQDDGRKRAADLEAQISKLQLERDRDHEALLDAQKATRMLESNIAKFNEDLNRKDDLIAMHEKEGRVKQERIDEALKMVSTLQATVSDLENNGKRQGSEVDTKSRELEALKKDNNTLLENLKAEQRNTERWCKGYAAVGSILAASEVEIRGVNLDASAAKLMKELDEQKHEVTKITHELEERKHAVEAQKLKTIQADREREESQDILLGKDDDIAALQEDLLSATVELREMLAKNDQLSRELALEAQRRADYEANVAAREKEINKLLEEATASQQEKNKLQAEWLSEKVALEDTARTQLSLAENDHRNALSALEQSLALAGNEAQSQLEFSDMCHTMAELLQVNSKTSSAVLARSLYERVTEILNEKADLKGKIMKLEEELDETNHQLKEARNHTIYVHEQAQGSEYDKHEHSIHHHHQNDRPTHTSHGRYNSHSHNGRLPYNETQRIDAYLSDGSAADSIRDRRILSRSGNRTSAGAEGRLREEAKVLRSKMASLQLKYDDFVGAVSASIGIKQQLGDRMSTDIVIERVKELMAEGASGSSHTIKSSKEGNNIKHLQRKFRIAIRTIETLDKLIEKLKQDGGSLSGSALLHKNHELQIELAELKNQLFNNSIGMDVGTTNDHSNVDQAMHELDKYRKFVDDVCREVGLRVTVKPDFALILAKIRELSGQKPTGRHWRSSSPSPSGSRRAGTSAIVRPPASPRTTKKSTSLTNRHLRAPFRP